MNENRFDVVLAGNYLTNLVAAVGLAERGRKVCLANPIPSWGGHFSRVQVGDQIFDPGAVSHEFTVFADRTVADPLGFDPRRRNDVARFNALIEDYTRSVIDLHRMDTPETVYRGRMYPDIVMTNRFEILRDPQLEERVRVEQEHVAANPCPELHPRDKKDKPQYLTRSYYEASIANHGATLHAAVFEPQFYKMSGLSTTRLLALYHRIAWLPVYYPETLRTQFTASPQVLPETYFCYPKAGHIGHFGEELLRRFEAAGGAVVRDPIARLEGRGERTIVLKDGRRISGRHLFWSLAHDMPWTQATGKPANVFERWSAMLVFANIERRNLKRGFSVLYCPDDDALFYRACNQTDSAGQGHDRVRVVIEVNPEYAARRGFADEASVVARVREDLCRLGILGDPAHLEVAAARTLRNVLLLPSRENWKLLENERDALLSEYPDVVFTRNVEAFFADTLNDQIVKGLRIAAQLAAG